MMMNRLYMLHDRWVDNWHLMVDMVGSFMMNFVGSFMVNYSLCVVHMMRGRDHLMSNLVTFIRMYLLSHEFIE